MQFTSVNLSSSGAANRVIPSGSVAGLDWQVVRADLHIQQQADQILADKQTRDLCEAWRAARECGCRQCRWIYRRMLAFYSTLGLRPPAREGVSAPNLLWYPRHDRTGPSERR